MKLSPEGLKLICKWEGYHRALKDGTGRCKAYRCPANVWTIGWGCTHGIKPGMIWTKDEAREGLRKELQDIEESVNRLVSVPLTQAQYDALVSFTYNVGSGALRNSTLLKRLNAGKYHLAWKQFPRWRRGGGRVLRGLENRRRDEQVHWRRDIPLYEPAQAKPDPEPVDPDLNDILHEPEPMPQAVDEPDAPKKQLRKTSRKWTLLDWIKWLFGVPILGSAGVASSATIEGASTYLTTLNTFVAQHGVVMLIGVCVAGFVLTQLVQEYMAEDVEDGRYEPSGDTSDA